MINTREYKGGSLFDGIGGFPLAGLRNEINFTWASEIEAFPIAVTKERFPNMQHVGDVTRLHGAQLEPVDVITFGSPCQDLSLAGRREGLDGSRSGLFTEAVRIIREMREATNGKYPRFAIWENVLGAFSSKQGSDFRAVLEEITESKIPMPNSGRWATSGVVRSNGIEAAWRVLDAQHWGVPQRRKRIFLVADFTGTSASEILFVEKSLRGHSETCRSEGQGIARGAENGTYSAGFKCGNENEPLTFSVGNISRGADAEPSDSGVCKTLRADMGDQHPCVVHPTITGTLCASGAVMSRPAGMASETDLVVAVRTANTSSNGCGINKDSAYTLDRTNGQAICTSQGFTMQGFGDYKDLDVAISLKQRDYKDATDLVVGYTAKQFANYPQGVGTLKASGGDIGGGSETIVKQGYKVRRLTPTECERLQGLPDNWTAISGASDTSRYKALGNGMAQPCVDFVISGIAKALREGENFGET